MRKTTNSRERGFTLIEGVVVLLVAGIVVAISTPRITRAMREYRINIAMRQMVDTLRRAKMEAASESVRVGFAIDPGNRQAGLAYLDDAGNVIRTEYISLPEDVSFEKPANVNSDPDGKTMTSPLSIAFNSKAKAHLQVFDSRGFPEVGFGNSITIMLGNGTDYRAVTMTSVGGIRTYELEDRTWVDTRSDHSGGDTTTGRDTPSTTTGNGKGKKQ